VQLRSPEDRVDLRDLLADLEAVSLGEAARHDQRARPATRLDLRQLEDRVDRLLARPVDERAGIDHQTVRRLRRLHDPVAGLGQHAQHQLGVDLVLGTAEGGEMDFHDGTL
jgi:hypothetical protein